MGKDGAGKKEIEQMLEKEKLQARPLEQEEITRLNTYAGYTTQRRTKSKVMNDKY
jgi:hypothetical protein